MGNASWPPARVFTSAPLFPPISLEDIKCRRGIPLEDTSRDAAIQRFLLKYQLVMEQKLGRFYRGRDRAVYRTGSEKLDRLPNVMNLIREAFERLLHYQYSLNDPSARAEEEQSVLELSRKASELWQEHPEWLVIWTRILGLLETGGLVCCPTVAWIFTQVEGS